MHHPIHYHLSVDIEKLAHIKEMLSEEAIENYIGASFIIVIWQRLSQSIR
jgi:hypothetical protein